MLYALLLGYPQFPKFLLELPPLAVLKSMPHVEMQSPPDETAFASCQRVIRDLLAAEEGIRFKFIRLLQQVKKEKSHD